MRGQQRLQGCLVKLAKHTDMNTIGKPGSVLRFMYNPTTISSKQEVSWNKIGAQGSYHAVAQFGKLSDGRQIQLQLLFHQHDKIKYGNVDQYNSDRGLTRELVFIQSLAEPNFYDEAFRQSVLTQGGLGTSASPLLNVGGIKHEHGVSPCTVLLDYGLTTHNDPSSPLPAIAVVIDSINTQILALDHRGWPTHFTADLTMTPVMHNLVGEKYASMMRMMDESGEVITVNSPILRIPPLNQNHVPPSFINNGPRNKVPRSPISEPII